MGFQYVPATAAPYGEIAYYAPLKSDPHAVPLSFKAGSKIVFLNDDSFGVKHTASGLGTTDFPPIFTNTAGFARSGNVIDGGRGWSTGSLLAGRLSQVFTLGPPATYYFGCAYHYEKNGMRDVIVSTK